MILSDLTAIILELNAALDTGKYDDIPMEEASQHIKAGDVVPWLKKTVERVGTWSLSNAETANDYQSALSEIYGGYAGDEQRKWLVEKRALCLLIPWTNEIIQQQRHWTSR
jgi:hypothetical protein